MKRKRPAPKPSIPPHLAARMAELQDNARRAAGLPERVVIDASHDNSGKDHERQPGVVTEIAAQVADEQVVRRHFGAGRPERCRFHRMVCDQPDPDRRDKPERACEH